MIDFVKLMKALLIVSLSFGITIGVVALILYNVFLFWILFFIASFVAATWAIYEDMSNE